MIANDSNPTTAGDILSTTAAVTTSRTPENSGEDADLLHRIHSLPPELFDMIQDFTFRALVFPTGLQKYNTTSQAPSQQTCDIVRRLNLKVHVSSAGLQEYDMTSQSVCARHISDLKILQLSRTTRAQYAEAFYQQRKFIFEPHSTKGTLWWLASIPAAHRRFVGGIAFIIRHAETSSWGDWRFNLWCRLYEYKGFIEHVVQTRFGAEIGGKIDIIPIALSEKD